MAKILDGKSIAKQIKTDLEQKISSLNIKPTLAIVIATLDESANTYASAISKSAQKIGIKAEVEQLSESVSNQEFQDKIKLLAEDSQTNGIIIQTPVPDGIDLEKLRTLIPPEKDVDGANPLSAGRLFSGLESFAPATAQAVVEILNDNNINPAGKHAVVIGRSTVIGKPIANLLLGMNATVTVCHSKTSDLAFYTRQADILVAAAGKAGLVGKEHIDSERNTIIIDVGTNFDSSGKMSGDVRFDEVQDMCGAISPVPGGVGPVTTAILLRNTYWSYIKQAEN